jgi:hypothetical protein
MGKFGDWLKKNIVANPLINPIGAVINTVVQDKTISAQNEALNQAGTAIQHLNDANSAQNQKLLDYGKTLDKYQTVLRNQQMQAPPVASVGTSSGGSSGSDNTAMYVIVGVVAVVVLYFYFKKKK